MLRRGAELKRCTAILGYYLKYPGVNFQDGGSFAFFRVHFNVDLASLERALVAIGMDVKTKTNPCRRQPAYKNVAW